MSRLPDVISGSLFFEDSIIIIFLFSKRKNQSICQNNLYF